MAAASFSVPAPVTRRVRAYFAPVARATGSPVLFDPAQQAAFDLDAPPAPWIDLGWIQNFTRKSASRSVAVLAGVPAAPLEQVHTSLQAEVRFQFLTWNKLTMSLATASQHMNVLAPEAEAAAILPGSTASSLLLNAADAAQFSVGQRVAVDADYAGQTGFVGSPISGAYLLQPLADVNYIRRVTFNLGIVSAVSSTGISLADPLIGGAPAAGLKLQRVLGFLDREGGSFYAEWSALFVMEGTQGERIFFHYPRLQPMSGAEEAALPVIPGDKGRLARIALAASFLALPVTDPLDGERVVGWRFLADS